MSKSLTQILKERAELAKFQAQVQSQTAAKKEEQAAKTEETKPVAETPMAAMLRKRAEALAIASQAASMGIQTGKAAPIHTAVSSPQATSASILMAQKNKIAESQQNAVDAAKSLIDKRAQEGFYDVAEKDKLPIDLPADVVSQKLLTLDAALIAKTPELRSLTIEINKNLRQYDELAYLLTDEQLHVIVEANRTTAGVIISTGANVNKSKSAKVNQIADNVSADDFL